MTPSLEPEVLSPNSRAGLRCPQWPWSHPLLLLLHGMHLPRFWYTTPHLSGTAWVPALHTQAWWWCPPSRSQAHVPLGPVCVPAHTCMHTCLQGQSVFLLMLAHTRASGASPRPCTHSQTYLSGWAVSPPLSSPASSSFSSCRLELTSLSSRATVSLTRALLVALEEGGRGEALALPRDPRPRASSRPKLWSPFHSDVPRGPATLGGSGGVQGPPDDPLLSEVPCGSRSFLSVHVCHVSGLSTCARTQNLQGVSPPTTSRSPRTWLTPVLWKLEGNFPGEMGSDSLCACQRDWRVPRKAQGGQGDGAAKEKEGLVEPWSAAGFAPTGAGSGRRSPLPGPQISTWRTGGCEGLSTQALRWTHSCLKNSFSGPQPRDTCHLPQLSLRSAAAMLIPVGTSSPA